MNRICTLGALAAAAAIASTVTPAAAQQEDLGHYEYRFDDDLLDAGVLDGNIPIIKGFVRGARVQLLRPRVSFVTEMLKSVERI